MARRRQGRGLRGRRDGRGEVQDASPLPWAGVTARTAAWLRRVSEGLQAFSVNCAHLGCPVRWLADAQLFMCPCHGGVYYADGTVAAGPPPHPLPQYPSASSGAVEIRTEPIPIDGEDLCRRGIKGLWRSVQRAPGAWERFDDRIGITARSAR